MMRVFVKPGYQLVIGNRNFPKQVISGPRHIFLFGRQIYGQFSTIPQQLILTSPELPTATQVPVICHLVCTWSRNLADLKREHLYAAPYVSNDDLTVCLREGLALALAYYLSFFPAEALVALPTTDEPQVTTVKRCHHRLAQCLADDMKQRLGSLGFVIKSLTVNITLPVRWHPDIEALWLLQHCQRHRLNLPQFLSRRGTVISLN
jgi:hypothetical protein